MTYLKSQMLFTDYKWTAKADHDNPKIIGGQDHSEVNRTEGYEMLHFINSLALSWKWRGDPTASFQQLEKIIRREVPSSIRTRTGIKEWIAARYPSFSS